MNMDGEESERRLELKREFGQFLDDGQRSGEYSDKLKALLTRENVLKNRLRLEVDVHDLRRFDDKLFTTLLSEPTECIQPFEDALEELVKLLNSDDPKGVQVRITTHEQTLRILC